MDDPKSVVKYSSPTRQQHVVNNNSHAENDETSLLQSTTREPELCKEVYVNCVNMYVQYVCINPC